MKIVLTREKGKNDKLLEILSSDDRLEHVNLAEIPCIEHAEGPDLSKLVPFLQRQQYSIFACDYIVITSPEAATVFGEAYNLSNQPTIGKVAAVGKATKETLENFGIRVEFVPSKATAATMCMELPEEYTDLPTKVFYPASAQAKPTLQKGLEKRGFEVTRLNTYNTVPVKFSEDQIKSAKEADVVSFASPSAVIAWLENIGGDGDHAKRIPAACIGETSAQACREMGWDEENIFYPEKPGIGGWASAVAEALEKVRVETLCCFPNTYLLWCNNIKHPIAPASDCPDS